MKELRFDTIPVQYRPLPFWSWNDKLDPAELRRQIRAMHHAGLGGFFMHARGGLQTAYLSEEWMQCINASLDEAAKLGMDAWLYDENGWPSGFGGGLVNGLGEKFQQKFLHWEAFDRENADPDRQTVAFYRPDGEMIGKTLPEHVTGEIYRISYSVNPYYVDNLDAEVVREFIRTTHEYYYRNIPENLRQHLRGIFTDEPQLSRDGIPWSWILEAEYRNAYELELLPELPALFCDLPGCEAVRVRFWKLATRLFCDNFMKQIHDWCREHDWQLTGHHLLEESCQLQLPCNGAIMPQYQYYDMPGVDHLSRKEPSAVAQTQVVSVAGQCGKKQILTESFAMTGWNFNFSGMKWLYQIQLAHGVNRLCQHLQGYTLRGLRKRDYPASFFYHQPWWEDYRKFNDYFSFCGMMLAENPLPVEVLVVHPQSSAWCHYTGDWFAPVLDFYTQTLVRVTEALDARFIAHHYADEQIAAAQGRVQDGKLYIGECAYSYVIVPMVLNLSAAMVALLREFAAAGGKILRVKNGKDGDRLLVDGVPASAEITGFFKSIPEFESESAAVNALPVELKISSGGEPVKDLLVTWREVDNFNGSCGRFYFIVSRLTDKALPVQLELPATGKEISVIDPLNGNISPVAEVKNSAGKLVFDWHFAAAESAMFFVSDAAAAAPAVKKIDFSRCEPVKTLDESAELQYNGENILTLDRCRFRIDNGEWQSDDVIQLQTVLSALRRDCDLEIEYRFETAADFAFEAPLTLVTETPEKYTFALNGQDFSAVDGGEFFDSAFRRIVLPYPVKCGENILTMKMRYTQPEGFYEQLEKAKYCETEYNKLTFDTEIESVYLVGDFAVRHTGNSEKLERDAVRYQGKFILGAPLNGQTVHAADLTAAGMPFFAGKVTLQKCFTLTESEAAAVKTLRWQPHGANSYHVKLNGAAVGSCFWEPYVLDLAGACRAGENILEIECVTSLRNMLGPHHLEQGEAIGVHTMSFNKDANAVGHKALPYNPGYCAVALGVEKVQLLGE